MINSFWKLLSQRMQSSRTDCALLGPYRRYIRPQTYNVLFAYNWTNPETPETDVRVSARSTPYEQQAASWRKVVHAPKWATCSLEVVRLLPKSKHQVHDAYCTSRRTRLSRKICAKIDAKNRKEYTLNYISSWRMFIVDGSSRNRCKWTHLCRWYDGQRSAGGQRRLNTFGLATSGNTSKNNKWTMQATQSTVTRGHKLMHQTTFKRSEEVSSECIGCMTTYENEIILLLMRESMGRLLKVFVETSQNLWTDTIARTSNLAWHKKNLLS